MAIRDKPPESRGEKTFYKGLGFCAYGADANAAAIDVSDGRIVRIRPLHYDQKYEPEEFKPWKIEARGKTFEPCMKTLIPPLSLGYKKRIYSPNRILYPLQRVDFDPNGDRKVENRGESGYVRISWDEALDIIVSEIKRVRAEYGPYGILCQGDGHGETKMVHYPHGNNFELFRHMGGYTQQVRNPDSWEGWWWGAKHVWGMEPVGMMVQSNVVADVAEHTELLLYWGCDAESTQWPWGGQIASRLMYWFTELGIKSVFICPDLNYTAAIHGDKWIPILPNTDAALYLAIAHVWLSEDTYDKDYVATHTVGFDRVRDYVLGKEDGTPKTPQWAAELCGVPSRIIKALAREWAAKRTSFAIGNGGGAIRGPYAHEPARLAVILLAMQGLGGPGVHQMKLFEWAFFGSMDEMALPRPMVLPNTMTAAHGWDFFSRNLPKQVIAKDLIHEAILNPPVSWYSHTMLDAPREDQFEKYTYPAEGCPEIHMIWTDSPSWVTCWNDSNAFARALRSPKIEFVLAQHPWMENDCLFADIILPVSTKFEEDDIACDSMGGQFQTLLDEKRCIEPRGEARSDYEIVCLIAERLGMLEEFTRGKSIPEWIRYGFDNCGAADFVTWEEFKEKGYFVIPTDPEWKKYKVGMRDFYEEPEKHPLSTPTGKLEFYSETLARHFPDDEERPPYPKWIPYGESHQESRLCERAGRYPLLMISNHPRWATHSEHEDMTWLREIRTCKIKGPDGYLYQPVWVHPEDAAERGIGDGDVVTVFNERGAVLCGAYVTERMMPGVVSSDHGASYDPIVPGELDRGGANNTLSPRKTTSRNATGIATSGFLVEVERADLDGLRRRYPGAFNRPYHAGAGLCIERVMDGGK